MKRYLKIWLVNIFIVFTIAIPSCLLGFHEGSKHYEVNLFIPNTVSPKDLKQAVHGYDACVKLEMRGSPICNCTVLDRGKID